MLWPAHFGDAALIQIRHVYLDQRSGHGEGEMRTRQNSRFELQGEKKDLGNSWEASRTVCCPKLFTDTDSKQKTV